MEPCCCCGDAGTSLSWRTDAEQINDIELEDIEKTLKGHFPVFLFQLVI